jgi:phage-related protein
MEMIHREMVAGETPLDWIGSSKSDLLAFPEPVIHAMGCAFGVSQLAASIRTLSR